ncbi:MAG: glycine zipper domain-containing protein [Planctomycetaceae bacterium]
MTRRLTAAGLLCIVVSVLGCRHMSYGEQGTLLGAGAGGLLGGIIGHQTGNTGVGAVLGTLAGGLGGAMIGDAEQAREERDVALAAYYSDQAQRARAAELSNADLINMAQNGLSDTVIVNAVNTQGGRFDLSPNALIALKQSGVSEGVIVAIQKSAAEAQTVVPAGAAEPAIVEHPHVVVVHPIARMGVVVGPPLHHGHWRHGRRYRW